MRLDLGLARLRCQLLFVLWSVGLTWMGVAGAQPQAAFASVRYHIEAAYDPTTHHIDGQVTIRAT